MKIDPHSPLAAAAVEKRRRKQGASAAGDDFASLLAAADGVEEVTAAPPVAPVGMVSGILALQEISDDEMQRRKAVRQGSLTLDALEDLRLSLLLGEIVASDRLETIRRRMREQAFEVRDPKLSALMREIETRAAVELAKLGL